MPDLLQVFIDFNNKVDWESLRKNIAELWEHLEPFAETVGEGLILFIRRVSDALADFLNSQEFKDFLKTIENWMDSVTPEDVANALANIAKGLIALKLALLGFSAIKAITGVLTTIKTFLSFFGVGGGAASAGAGMSSAAASAGALSVAIGALTTALAVVAAAVAGWHIGTWIAEKLELDPKPFNETMQGIKDSFTDGSWKQALNLWKDDIYNAFVTLGNRQAEAWNKMCENLKTTLNNALNWILKKIGAAKSALSGGLGSALGNAFKGYSISVPSIQVPATSIPTIPTANIPYLASGTVIPPNSPFVAVLGDQKRGTNVEAPLSTIEDAVENVWRRNGGMGGGDIYLHSTVECEGYQLLDLIQKLDGEYFNQTGKHAFA